MGNASRATRAAAHASIKPITGLLGMKVLKFIYEEGRGGSTSDQAETALAMTHQTVSARFNELRNKGLLEESGEMRKTRSGRKAAVYVVTEKGRLAANGIESREPTGPLFRKPVNVTAPSVVTVAGHATLVRKPITRTPV
jgi:hypothetical protein